MQIESSGTLTATLGTEHTLAAPSAAKTRVLVVDAAAMTLGETVTMRFKGPVLSGGTERLIREATFSGPLSEAHVQSPPILMPQGGTVTLTQAGGTGRSYPWALLALD